MCFACEEEQMLAAYRAYMAQRKAARAAAEAGESAPAGAQAATPDWAKGTWFAAAADAEKE